MTQPNVYTIKTIFPTLQGEGLRAGTKAVFVRFAGCNLWSGRPEDRSKGTGACSLWCDTDFFKGKALTAEGIINTMEAAWKAEGEKWCVLTGGEPMLQVDKDLIDALHAAGWKIAIETNGTLDPQVTTDTGGTMALLEMIDWVCVSPKLGSTPKVTSGDELKVILPGAAPPDPGWTDEALRVLGEGRWKYRYVQPQDPIDVKQVEASFLHGLTEGPLAGIYKLHLQRCVSWVAEHPDWRLSAQMHKFVGLS